MGCMGASLLFSILFPLALFFYFKKKKGCDAVPFGVGCLVMLVFALILESMVHQLVLLRSPVGQTILDSTLLYALYGGLMAGLFEETGRYIAFRTVLKKYWPNDRNALMYGAGHGGFEVLAILGLSMVSNLSLALLINTGHLDQVTSSLSGDALTQMEGLVTTLTTSAPADYLLGIVERIFAVSIHLSLSVPVWFAAKKGKTALYPLAILIHALVDGITVVLSKSGTSALLTEGCIGLMAVCAGLFALAVWRSNADKEVSP